MSTVGVSKLYVAILKKDDTSGVEYETPIYLPGVRSFDADVKTNSDTLYAENKAWENETALESIELKIDVADLSSEHYAKLLGHTVTSEGAVLCKASDNAPYVAIMFETDKSNGKKLYKVFYKGKFTEPKDGAKGKEGKTDFQTKEIATTFLPLAKYDAWKCELTQGDSKVPTDINTKFFEKVYMPSELK